MIDVDLLKPGGFIRPCVLRQLAGPECSAQEQEEQAKESTTPRDRSEQSQLDMSAANDSSQRTNAPGKMEQHIHAMKTLHSAAKDTLHEPRTLDHYSNADLNEAQLGALDEEQVLIRYFAQLAGGKIGRRSKQSKNKFIQARRMIFEYFTAGLRRHSSSYTYSDPEKAQQPKAQQPADQQGTDQDGGGNTTNTPLRLIPENADHRHILVVPHLWLIMVDGLFILPYAVVQWCQSCVTVPISHYSSSRTSMRSYRPKVDIFSEFSATHFVTFGALETKTSTARQIATT